MNKKNLLTRSLLGAMGLGIGMALFGATESAKAQASCGPGDNWVENCPAGQDILLDSTAYLGFEIDPAFGGGMLGLVLDGEPVTITRQNAVDQIINDPDFAGVGDLGFGTTAGDNPIIGLADGYNGVIKTEIEEQFISPDYTLTGMGNGAIVEATDFGINRPDLAWSFFNVFASIEGPFGQARNTDPIVVEANKWLVGVSPQEIDPVDQPPQLPSSFVGTPNEMVCDETDPLAAILYCGFEDTEFYLVNDLGEFIDDLGNPTADPNEYVLFGTLGEEVHGVPPVPEPSATAGLILLGLGSVFGIKRKNK